MGRGGAWAPVVCALMLVVGGGVGADELSQAIHQGFADTTAELDRSLLPAERQRAPAPVDPSMSCEELYRVTTDLVPLGERRRAPFMEQPRNMAVTALGLVVTPAFALLGVTAYADWREEAHRQTVNQRVAELRRAMADRHCFVRN